MRRFLLRHRIVLALARLYLLAPNPRLVAQFVRRLRYLPDPALPRSWHEKLLWRKLVDRDPRFVAMSDKLAAKDIARARCPELAVARVLWAGSDPAAIPAALLAGDAVVKVNHGSAYNIFVAGGVPPRAAIAAKVAGWLAWDYSRRYGEWGYRDVPRRVFVEERLTLGGGDAPTDFKVHVYGDRIGHVWVADTPGRLSRTYTADIVPLDVADLVCPEADRRCPDSPAVRALIAQAIELARRALGDCDYARVDLMLAGGRFYFGEYTLYPGSGYDLWFDPALPRRAAALWDLRQSAFLRAQHRGLAGVYAEALRAALDEAS